jgi:hypothetical protein
LSIFALIFTLAISKYECDNWEDIHEIAADEIVKEGAEEGGQDNHQTKAT